jgi:hypothetical protein
MLQCGEAFCMQVLDDWTSGPCYGGGCWRYSQGKVPLGGYCCYRLGHTGVTHFTHGLTVFVFLVAVDG